jgi:hypothetical protein
MFPPGQLAKNAAGVGFVFGLENRAAVDPADGVGRQHQPGVHARLTALTGGGSDYADHQTEIRLHRKWLAAQMTEANWREDPKTCSLDANTSPWHALQTSSSLYRLQAAAQFGQAQDAVATVEALASRASYENGALYECGRIYALAAGAVKGDAALADHYAVRAVALLRQAADAGYNDSQNVQKDPDLDALRSRDDFKNLLKERFQTHP